MDPVKVGVIGCGVIGSRNLETAQASELCEVVAAADLRIERRQWAAKEAKVPRVYEEGRDLIDNDEEVEAVILAFPAGVRGAMAMRALAAGKHVLLEKPVAMNAYEVQTLMEWAGDDLKVGCFSARYRGYESAQVATEFVTGGGLGEIREIYFRCFRSGGPPTGKTPPPWRESFAQNAGGILTNWSCYDLDHVLGICGWTFKPRTVLAQTWRCAKQFRHAVAPESDADAHFTALAIGEDGTALNIERAEFAAREQNEVWEIVGSEGTLYLSMLATGERELVYDDGSNPEDGVVRKSLWKGDDREGGGTPWVIDDFCRAIREDRAPMTSLEQSLVLAQITDAIYESARTGDAVRID
ncbi:MAG: Gfo/Idh/MocA family protein [Armatimonadota bacterium]